jgi:hypothetical protein
VFGRVTTLQNVAVISCVQNTPVVGVWTANGDAPIEVADCAEAGAGAEARNHVSRKTAAAMNVSRFMISAIRFAASKGQTAPICATPFSAGETEPLCRLFPGSAVGAGVAGRRHSEGSAPCARLNTF